VGVNAKTESLTVLEIDLWKLEEMELHKAHIHPRVNSGDVQFIFTGEAG